MRNLILTLSLILGLGTSVSANDKPFAVGDVFFCQGEVLVEWDWEKKELIRYNTQNFQFSIIDDTTIQFGTGGYLNEIEMSIERFGFQTLKGRIVESSVFSLHQNKFTFAQSHYNDNKIITATCDRF